MHALRRWSVFVSDGSCDVGHLHVVRCRELRVGVGTDVGVRWALRTWTILHCEWRHRIFYLCVLRRRDVRDGIRASIVGRMHAMWGGSILDGDGSGRFGRLSVVCCGQLLVCVGLGVIVHGALRGGTVLHSTRSCVVCHLRGVCCGLLCERIGAEQLHCMCRGHIRHGLGNDLVQPVCGVCGGDIRIRR